LDGQDDRGRIHVGKLEKVFLLYIIKKIGFLFISNEEKVFSNTAVR